MKNYVEYFLKGKTVRMLSGEEKSVEVPPSSYMQMIIEAIHEFGKSFKNMPKVATSNTPVSTSDFTPQSKLKLSVTFNGEPALLDSISPSGNVRFYSNRIKGS